MNKQSCVATRLPPESAGESVGSPPLRRLLRRREGVGTPVLRVRRVHRVRTRFPGGGGPVGTPPCQVGLPQLRSHHGGALRCAADELLGVVSCRRVRAARIGCSRLSVPAARSVFQVWVGEAVLPTRAEDFAPWPRLRCGSVRSGTVGRSVEGLFRSHAGAACSVQERRYGRPRGGFVCSRAGWWFGGRRFRRLSFRASRRRAAGPGPVAFRGLPRPTSYKAQVSVAARRTTLSAHKAMRRDEVLRVRGLVASCLCLRRALRHPRRLATAVGGFGTEDPGDRVVISVSVRVFCAVVLGRVSRVVPSREFLHFVRVLSLI